jgi:hypothetical protein
MRGRPATGSFCRGIGQTERRDPAGSLEAPLSDDLCQQGPEFADRFVNLLAGGIHFDALLLRDKCCADIAAELLVILRRPKLFHRFLDLKLNSLHCPFPP